MMTSDGPGGLQIHFFVNQQKTAEHIMQERQEEEDGENEYMKENTKTEGKGFLHMGSIGCTLLDAPVAAPLFCSHAFPQPPSAPMSVHKFSKLRGRGIVFL
jgi:hypothetical protein